MCTVVMEKTSSNLRFLAMNIILSKTEVFSSSEIEEELLKQGGDKSLVHMCLDDLIENGLIFEIGSKYKVRIKR